MIIGILIASSISSVNALGMSSVSIPTSQNTEIKSTNSLYDNINKLDFVPGEIIVKFKENVQISVTLDQDHVATGLSTIDSLNEMFGINSIEKLDQTETSSFLSNVYKLKFPQDKSISSVLSEYLKDSNVEYAEPNFIYSICSLPNDPYFSKQWALNQSNDVDIDAPEAWDLETGIKNIVIAVVDSGIDYNHPDLKDNVWINKNEIPGNNIDDDGNGFVDDVMGWNFTGNNNDPLDELGHGTHCSGIIGAVGNNSIGISGVCWNCSIMPVKVFGSSGSATLGIIIRGIKYAADNGANVISMSWGSSGESQLLKYAIDYAYSKGVVLVGGAGNEYSSHKFYPAAFDNVISVAAIDKDNFKADFSNYGAWVDVASPGVDIYSTMPTYHVTLNDPPYSLTMDYSYASGTSMACPNVAGVVGLILSKNPALNQEEVKTLIRSTASKVGSDTYIGTGNVNSYNCVKNNSAPVANLDSSLDDKEIEKTVEIRGTAAGITFQKYNIYMGFGVYPESWNLVYTSNIPVEDDMLSLLNTSVYKDGRYSIRLELEDIYGTKFQDRTVVLINNVKTTVYVDDDGTADYNTISEAVNNSGTGDNIYVYNGTYRENVIVEKQINLTGENKNTTIVIGITIYRSTNDIEVSGFTFELTESEAYTSDSNNFYLNYYSYQVKPDLITSYNWIFPCFVATKCGNLTVKNNNFLNFTAPLLTPDLIAPDAPTLFEGVGIHLDHCSACQVKDNMIIGHVYDPSVEKEGNSPTVGINLVGCDSVFVENNLIINNNVLQDKDYEEGSILAATNESLPAGIYILAGVSNSIKDNKIENNFKGIQGVMDAFSGISNNLLRNNIHGIYYDMLAALYVNIHNNMIQNNKNGISLGIGCSYNNIYNNIIEDNTVGIKGLEIALKIFEGLMPDSQYNTISNNSIKNNDIGIYGRNWAKNTIHDNNIENNKDIGLKLAKSKNNIIYRNNFINDGKLFFGKRNAKSSLGNKWYNGDEGNYWDDYKGLLFKRLVDIDKDGFGNIPYHIPILQFDRHPKLEPYSISI